MKYVLTQKEMQDSDANTTNTFQVPSMILMERAALSVIEAIKQDVWQKSEWETLQSKEEDVRRKLQGCLKTASVLVVCGSGNNGGDGFAVARLLIEQNHNRKLTVLFAGDSEHMTESCQRQRDIFLQYASQRNQVEIVTDWPNFSYDIVIDALFGIGLNRDITGKYQELIKQMNSAKAYKVALDIPSGIHADTGQVLKIAFLAHLTVTFAFLKRGQLLFPGRTYSGRIVTAQIGITKDSFLGMAPKGFCYENGDIKSLAKRRPDGNKGSFGKVSIFAGSSQMGGAAVLSAMAAYRMGSGYVRLFTHANNRSELLKEMPEVVYSVYEDADSVDKRLKEAVSVYEQGSVALIGPGIGKDDWAKQLVERIIRRDEKPLLIDADACNIIAESEALMEWLISTASTRKFPIVMTPHLMEFARLSKTALETIQEDVVSYGVSFAKKTGVILICKDACTVVVNSVGTVYFNNSGNEGMATAGCGDVLSGIVASLLGQEQEAYFAACMGVLLHGLCGDQATEKTNARFVVASDLIQNLSSILV